MGDVLGFVIVILGSIFFCSFVGILILCRYKNVRKRTASYVKKLARSELGRCDVELIDKNDKRPEILNSRLETKCQALLDLCARLDLNVEHLTSSDINKLYYVVRVARSITEDKAQLLDCQTDLLLRVSKTMSKMEQQLKDLEETEKDIISV